MQAMIYMTWLLDRTGSSPVAEAQRVDARVLQAMALSPRELFTEQDLEQFLRERGPERRASAPRPVPNNSHQVCWRYQQGMCRSPCPNGRLHPVPAAGRGRGVPPRPPLTGFPGHTRRQ